MLRVSNTRMRGASHTHTRPNTPSQHAVRRVAGMAGITSALLHLVAIHPRQGSTTTCQTLKGGKSYPPYPPGMLKPCPTSPYAAGISSYPHTRPIPAMPANGAPHPREPDRQRKLDRWLISPPKAGA